MTKHKKWPIRTVAFAIVAFIHAGIFDLLFRPVWVWQSPASSPNADTALKVRFIKIEAPPKQRPAEQLYPESLPRSVASRHSSPRKTQQAREGATVPPADSPVAPGGPLATSTAEAPTGAIGDTYIAGGGNLPGRSTHGQQNIRIPDGSKPEKSRFRMVDPRTQGLAGVIRMIGSFTGAIDPHCLDLEVWRGMTPEERIAHHISLDDMEAIENNYRCSASRSTAPGK